jgi:hypothetical protein
MVYCGILSVAVLRKEGKRLERKISQRMEDIWNKIMDENGEL